MFSQNLEKVKKKKKTLNDFVYEEEEDRAKPTIIENTGDDTEFLEAFF